MKIRPHRGSLADAMADVREFATSAEVIDYIIERESPYRVVTASDIECEPYTYDARIRWDTHLITIYGHATYFTDGPLDAGAL